MKKLPPWMTAPLNSAMDCLPVFWESEDDGQAVSEQDEAGLLDTTLLSTFDICICCFVETVLLSFLCSSNSYGLIAEQFA